MAGPSRRTLEYLMTFAQHPPASKAEASTDCHRRNPYSSDKPKPPYSWDSIETVGSQDDCWKRKDGTQSAIDCVRHPNDPARD
jgi:hypothetical protein